MSKVLLVLGSKSDLRVAERSMEVLKKFSVAYDIHVASAHRTPKKLEEIVTKSDADIVIAIAGLSAALPGSIAAMTVKPVIGVPVSGVLNMDSILSVVQMPPGIPVAAVGLDRGDNATMLAIQIIGMNDQKIRKKITEYRQEMADRVLKDSEEVRKCSM